MRSRTRFPRASVGPRSFRHLPRPPRPHCGHRSALSWERTSAPPRLSQRKRLRSITSSRHFTSTRPGEPAGCVPKDWCAAPSSNARQRTSVGATNALRLASLFVSDCSVVESALATVSQEMHRSLAPTFRAQAAYEENLGMWEAAAKSWEKVLLGQPDDAHAAHGVAEALLASGGDLEHARRRAEQAVANVPDDAQLRRTLARVYSAAGMTESARRTLDIAENLESRETIGPSRPGLLRRVGALWKRG